MGATAGDRSVPHERSGSRFVCADLEIDVGRQRVLQAGRDVELPKLSFDLLLAIVRVAPNVLSIEAMIERVWAGIIVNPETVIQRISLLREALGDDSRNPRYIGSLRARGYFFIPPVADENDARPHEPGVRVSNATATTGGTYAGQAPEPALGTLRLKLRFVTAACALLALLVGLYFALSHRAAQTAYHPGATASPMNAATMARTVAVMPFRNLSSNSDDASLAAGLPEMIINRLSGVQKLAVIARSSSFALHPDIGDVHEIGRQLNSAHLVEGNVQRSGDLLRVTVQVIDTLSGTLIWSESFDRRVGDIFAIQDDISNRITSVLAERIDDLGAPPGRQERSTNIAAHLSYFHGLSLLRRFTVAETAAAIPLFQKAIDLDAGFAGAYASLYDAHLQESAGLRRDLAAERNRWQPLLDKALRINPRSGTALLARAMWADENDREREADFKRGLEMDPSNGRGTLAYAEFLFGVGREQEGRRMLDRALWIDPLSPRARFRKVMVDFNQLGGFGVEQKMLEVLEVDPDFHPALQRYGKYRWILHGLLAESIQVMEHAIAVDPQNPWTRFTAMAIYLDLGDEAAARDVAAGSPFSERSSQLLLSLYRGEWRRAGLEAFSPTGWSFGEFESWGAPEALRDYALRTGEIDRAAKVMESRYGLPPGPQQVRINLMNFRIAAMLAELRDAQARKTEGDQLRTAAAAWNDANEAKYSSLYAKRMRARLWLLDGQPDAALQELSASFRAGDYVQWWYTLEHDPAWLSVHDDPRFRAIDAQVREYVRKQSAEVEELRRRGEIPRRDGNRPPPRSAALN
jgi:TolB-like protein/DNA-binding winged helix-turn-helix (wHTH) protein